MIEKRISHQLLNTGELILTPNERTALALPEHTATVTIDLEGEEFVAQWSSRSRKLSGEVLLERLQDYGQEDGLLRLRLVGQVYRLVLLPPGTAMQFKSKVDSRTTKKNAARKSRKKTVDRQFHPDSEYDWNAKENGAVGFLKPARDLLSEQLTAAGFDTLELVKLRLQGERLATLDNFTELLAVDIANVERMPHQEAVARHALSKLRGRAILADEVGLGKTIEAGFAVKELTLRGLAKRVLILCPATLREQWRDEMSSKFDLSFDVAHTSLQVRDQEKLILTLDLGVRALTALTKRPWDVVIVDEAHRVAGSGARKRRELVTALTGACRYALFLTATPIQNDLLELYRLIELLRPGTFTSVSEFKRQYMRGNDPRTPKDPAALRRLISSAMVRTTRAQAGVDRVVRRPVDVPIDLGPRERELYALSTELLRNVMRDPGDSMRRRSLALRLTASPFSMGTTALRMADRHPDPVVRDALQEVGHLAMDIQCSAREDTALRITSEWVRNHGRVLIFTQHTDTVTGLLRRLAAEGLDARAFHGSMSATERAATVAAFRAGEAPIMISTDAGAEGQNLQFCNCVLNYDLPWNPMRIEQRIGRVDRLTQPCDEVFVANLYARGTIDEQVYRLLAEKLRMFELLFGQVTTILGELDESKSVTFESRVLEALFAEDDSRMKRLLSQLGSELADARRRASTLIAADTTLSSWMAAAFEHRKELGKAGSNELAPEVAERTRIRQRNVQSWVRKVLKALDAQTIHDTGDGEGAFLTVQFDDVVAKELGNRTLLHIAFDRLGMEQHADAELCAVGSPVFEELLGLLKERGDMHATVPIVPDDPGPSPLRYSPDLTLVERRFVPPGSWSGQATFRTTIGEAESTEYVVTADINANKRTRMPRRPLADGERLPAVFGKPAEVITEFERVAAETLDALREDMVEEVSTERNRELLRIQAGYNAQISEATPQDQVRLRSALAAEEQRLTRVPDIRARAKLLAFTIAENDWPIQETWAGPGGIRATLTYEWNPRRPPAIKSFASKRTITVIALCRESHVIDESERARCGSCDTALCRACGDDGIFADCAACGLACCGRCRRATGGLCRGCSEPIRAPELDEKFAVGWRLSRGVTLHVGQRRAELARPGQSAPSLVVRDEDVDDPARIRLRAMAIQSGLPADTGLVVRNVDDRPQAPASAGLLLRSSSLTVGAELAIAESDQSEVDECDPADLPVHEAVPVEGERSAGLAVLLASLRAQVPPPASPCVLLTRRSEFVDIYLEPDRLVERTVATSTAPRAVMHRTAPVKWRKQSTKDALLAEAELAGLRVRIERRNDAVLVTTRDGNKPAVLSWVAVPDGSSAEEQIGWYQILRSLGTPGGRVGQPKNQTPMVEPNLSPSECTLVDRSVRPVAEVASVAHGAELVPAQRASLVAVVGQLSAVEPATTVTMPTDIARQLLERVSGEFTAAVSTGFDVREAWRGHGTAVHEYRTFNGRPVPPKLDDIRFRLNDFGVCRDGHFYAPGTSVLCGSCSTWTCRACDPLEHQAAVPCPGCSAQVCRRCLTTEHAGPSVQCKVCESTACSTCGRDPQVRTCPICCREMCRECRSDETCSACAALTPTTDEQLQKLPPDLAASGATVLVGSDRDAMTVVVNRGDTVEQAVVRDGNVDRWVVFGRNEIDDTYQLRLAASRELGMQISPRVATLDHDVVVDTAHVVVESRRFFCASWAVGDRKLGQDSRWYADPDVDLASLILAEFKAPTMLPSAAGAMPAEVHHALRGTRPVDPVEFTMRWIRTGHDVIVTESAMISRTIDPYEITDEATAWIDGPTECGWALEGWTPAPHIRAHTSCGTAQAVIVGLASALALGVRVGGRTSWYTIVASPSAPWATSLSRLAGVEDADEAVAFVDPNQIRYSSVRNAIEVRRQVRPVGTIDQGTRPGFPDVTRDALDAWALGAHISTPQFGSLPSELATAMQDRWQPARPWTVLTIGAEVEEAITVAGGLVSRHQVSLMPGHTDARRIDQATGYPADAGVIDWEGHFTHGGE
ncbi:helicase [Mycobacterium asiaticum]|uniref:Helicase n=1 Tax=Mycobacterium asiaticum TaxID=1790 RepID=A0A1A3P181_MYCAS|nr:SNF2-related protein [Mycobacterium asiaticum]OBK27430.1 helicase [Mycobacterium asiaticum]